MISLTIYTSDKNKQYRKKKKQEQQLIMTLRKTTPDYSFLPLQLDMN